MSASLPTRAPATPAPPLRSGAAIVLRPSAETTPWTLSGRDAAWWVRTLSRLNLVAVGFICLLVCFISERWWLSGLLTYLPRQPYAIPSLLLFPVALWCCPRIAWVNAVAFVLVLGPLMGPSVPRTSTEPAPGRHVLRIASGNLQEGKGSLLKLISEIEPYQPDIVVFQEASQGCETLLNLFDGWQVAHLNSYYIGSRYPLRVVDHCRTKAFDRWTAVAVEIDTPDGTIVLGNIHLMTPRHGASGLTLLSPLTGAGVEEFEWHQQMRDEEAGETRTFFNRLDDRPQLVIGDFNVPTTSSHFQTHWGDRQSAFETAGYGYGYTSPCNASRKWFANTPWMRIDHVLADDRWSIHHCRIGRTDGSDHRLLFTELSLK